ncbi:MAG: hypothetical protein DMF75_17915 [Acidobacteria bacterium]|nr:MAG: hypothetical protein DMF75_17915 [Acidobacteriota bacterium]
MEISQTTIAYCKLSNTRIEPELLSSCSSALPISVPGRWICTPPRFDWLGLHRNAGNVAGDKQIADVNGRARGINFHPDSQPEPCSRFFAQSNARFFRDHSGDAVDSDESFPDQ